MPIDKEHVKDKNKFLSNLEPFNIDDVPEIQGLITIFIDPQLLETIDKDLNLKMVQDHATS